MRRRGTTRFAVATTAVALSLTAAAALAGCGDEDAATTTTAASTGSGGASTTDAGTGTTGGSSTEPVTKVDANTATIAELTDAFTAAGVPNAARWAREVEEYRPYTDDGWAHLHDELSKYDIDDATFEQITGVLTV